MGRALDLQGRQFGKWRVGGRVDNVGTKSAWACTCECGTKRAVKGTDLLTGRSKSCGCALRSTSKEVRERQRHKQTIATAKKTLDDPNASMSARDKADRTLRLADKHSAEIESSIAVAQQARAQQSAEKRSTDEISRLRFDYPEDERLGWMTAAGFVARDVADRESVLALRELLNRDLAFLDPVEFSSARAYLEERLKWVEIAIRHDTVVAREHTEAAAAEQAKRDDAAIAQVNSRIMAEVLPILQADEMDQDKRTALRATWDQKAAQLRHRANDVEGFDAQMGFDRKLLFTRAAEIWRRLADRLRPFMWDSEKSMQEMDAKFYLNEAYRPSNFNFRTWTEKVELVAAIKFFYSLYRAPNGELFPLPKLPPLPAPIRAPQPPRPDHWRSAEIAEDVSRRYELEKQLPQDPNSTLQPVVYLVSTVTTDDLRSEYIKNRSLDDLLNGKIRPRPRDKMFWPWGPEVKPGEIYYDSMLKAWVMPPEPADADPNWSDSGRMECVQDAHGNWKYMPESQLDAFYAGGMKEMPRRWAQPEIVRFIRGKQPATPAHSEFRYGEFYTPDDIAQGSRPDKTPLEQREPPKILPDLTVTAADCVATPPESREHYRDKRIDLGETPWQRDARLKAEKAKWGTLN